MQSAGCRVQRDKSVQSPKTKDQRGKTDAKIQCQKVVIPGVLDSGLYTLHFALKKKLQVEHEVFRLKLFLNTLTEVLEIPYFIQSI